MTDFRALYLLYLAKMANEPTGCGLMAVDRRSVLVYACPAKFNVTEGLRCAQAGKV